MDRSKTVDRIIVGETRGGEALDLLVQDAELKLRRKNYAGARTSLVEALKLSPDNANVQLDLAELLDARGDKPDAIEWYQKFLKNKNPLPEDTRRVRERLRLLKEPASDS